MYRTFLVYAYVVPVLDCTRLGSFTGLVADFVACGWVVSHIAYMPPGTCKLPMSFGKTVLTSGGFTPIVGAAVKITPVSLGVPRVLLGRETCLAAEGIAHIVRAPGLTGGVCNMEPTTRRDQKDFRRSAPSLADELNLRGSHTTNILIDKRGAPNWIRMSAENTA